MPAPLGADDRLAPAMAGDHWDDATEAAKAAGVELEPLDGLDEVALVTDVMTATWGAEQNLPGEAIRALQGSGNHPWGAFASGRLVGYVLGWLGWDDGGVHAHSHMLAVDREWQSKGVGLALKLAQRAEALDRGISVVRWTFDPTLSRNAYFNLAKLGALADGFRRNFYGAMIDDINRGERSDRLVVRWELRREPPGPAPDEGNVVLDRVGSEDAPEPSAVRLSADPPALVRIPRDHAAVRAADAALARRWRDAVADALEGCLDTGLVVSGFTSTSTYVLT